MPLTLAEIRELRDKLEPLSFAAGGIQVKFPFQTEELCLTAFPSTRERHEKMRQVLESYQKRFLRVDLELQPDSSLCWEFLQRIDFPRLKNALVAALKAEIEALLTRPQHDPLYAFVVGVSPAHHGITVFWNTPDNWAAHAEHYAASGHPAHPATKYNGPDFLCEFLSGNLPVWKTVWDILTEFDQISGEFYDLTGGGGIFYSLYENRFRSTAVHALREVAPLLDSLPRTADFICYVQDYVGAGDGLFLMMETVPEKQLRELMPWLLSNTGTEAASVA